MLQKIKQLSSTKNNFFVLFFFMSFCVLAQNEWNKIAIGNYQEAKNSWKGKLQKDSLNLSAIEGLIYLSEVTENKLDFERYCNKYIALTTDTSFEELFIDIVSNPKATPYVTVIQAEKEKKAYEFKKYNELIRTVSDKLDWYFAGPFENIEGSGHIVDYAIENKKIDFSEEYKTGLSVSARWHKPSVLSADQQLDFHNYLPSVESGTYYAATNFKIEKKADYQVRVRRENPIKVWLNQKLVFSTNEIANPLYWDNDVITLSIDSGNHQLLVKSS
ncbi:MAG: hypothetical protein AB8B61_05445, partial [Cyclobacteriaceae bacterium]